MKPGVIHLVDSDGPLVEKLRELNPLPEDSEFDELDEAIDVEDSIELSDGRTIQVGRIAAEQLTEDSEVHIRSENIR